MDLSTGSCCRLAQFFPEWLRTAVTGWGSRIFSYRPGRIALANMLGVSVANFFLIYWLKYTHLKVDGESIRDWMPFAAYLRFTLTHTSIRDSHFSSDAINLGAAGYGYAVLLMAGFALSGWFCLCHHAFGGLLRGVQPVHAGAGEPDAVLCEPCGDGASAEQGSRPRPSGAGSEKRWNCTPRQVRANSERTRVTRSRQSSGTARDAGSSGLNWWESRRVNDVWTRISDVRYTSYCTERIDVMEKLAGAS